MEFDIRDKILYGFKEGIRERRIVIPDGVEEIAYEAFEECMELEEVIMPDSIKVIGSGAFYNCQRLRNVTMSENLVEIGERAFLDCEYLENIFLKNNVKIIDEYAFAGCDCLTNVIMSEGVEKIEPNAFAYCKKLNSINIPNSVEKIGYHAFRSCENLKSVQLPRNLKKIARNSFYRCYKLEKIQLPTGLNRLDINLFSTHGFLLSNPTYDSDRFSSLKWITAEEGVFENLDDYSKYISLPSCIKNYYDGKIHYREEDIKAFKDFLKKYKMKYLKLYLKKEKTIYSQQLFHFTELFRFALYDAAIIPYKYVRHLVDIIDDVGIRHMLLQYINQKAEFDVELDRFDIGEFGDEDSKKHKH